MTDIEDRETFALITYWAGVIQHIAQEGFQNDWQDLLLYMNRLEELVSKLSETKKGH